MKHVWIIIHKKKRNALNKRSVSHLSGHKLSRPSRASRPANRHSCLACRMTEEEDARPQLVESHTWCMSSSGQETRRRTGTRQLASPPLSSFLILLQLPYISRLFVNGFACLGKRLDPTITALPHRWDRHALELGREIHCT